jgi:hypothetical protein
MGEGTVAGNSCQYSNKFIVWSCLDMTLRVPLCLFNRHAPLRHRVKWDGLNFVGKCRFCKRPIRKQDHGAWRKEWMEPGKPQHPF